MPVVGTAGHVDHGKSTLVTALTGRDPDRWDEEKRRGLTIDLGFAWTTLPGDVEASFVDVPGHERFIKNMLAGIEGIDVALLVVAADEGWMPQSEEHLAVIDLMRIERGVVALTRVDLVDDDLAELAELEVEEHLAGTSLEGSPVVRVAAPTGRGVAEVAAALAAAVEPEPPDGDRPRLWVDRSFAIAGAGTVVTGTLTGGALREGDTVMLWPGGRTARIRSLQSHETGHAVVAPGRRVAVNLVGLDRAEVPRGTLLGRPGAWRETRHALVSLRRARYVDAGLTDRGAYHLHLGSGSWPIRLRLLDDDAGLLRFDTPIPLATGDRFVLRDVGRRWVAGGGIVLDPAPPRKRPAALAARDRLEPVATGPPDDRATALLAVRGLSDLDELAAHSDGGVPAGGVTVGTIAVDRDRMASMEADAVGLVEAYHRDNPLRPGMPTASLSSRLDVPMAMIEAMVEGSPQLVDGGSTVAAAGFGGGWGEAEEQEWQRAKAELEAAGAAAPRASALHLDDELLHALLRDGRLVRVAEDLVYLTEQLDALEASLRRLPDGFTVADFRDAAGLSRRQAVPLLEWFDRAGVTVRSDDKRTVRPLRPGPRSSDDAPTR